MRFIDFYKRQRIAGKHGNNGAVICRSRNRNAGFQYLYMMYKKLEAMAITTDSMESVQSCLHLLNALLTEER